VGGGVAGLAAGYHACMTESWTIKRKQISRI